MKHGPRTSFFVLLITVLFSISSCDPFGSGPSGGTDGTTDGGTTGGTTDGGTTGGTTDGDTTTVDTTAPGNVTDLTATAIAGGKVTLSWTPPSDADFAGVDVTWDNGGTAVQNVAAGNATCTTAALTDGTTYVFSVKSRDATGNVASGSTATAKADATPPAEVTPIDGYSHGTNWLSFSWINPETSDYKGCRVSYTLAEVSKHEDYTGNPNAVGDTSKQTNASIGSLAGLTSYTFTLQSYDATGNLSAGITKTCITDKAWTTLLEDDFTGATSSTWNTTGYKSFNYSGTDYPMYGMPDGAPTSVGAYSIISYGSYTHDSFYAGGDTNTLIVLPVGGILTVGKAVPTTPSDGSTTPDGAFDLSGGYKVKVGMWSNYTTVSTEWVETYLDNNTTTATNSVHGDDSLLAYLKGNALAYRTHSWQMVYDLEVRSDGEFGVGEECALHPNAADAGEIAVGRATSYISIRNNTGVEIAIDYIKIYR